MTYRDWFDAHGARHKKIIDKLIAKGYNKDQMIDYFRFESMLIHEPDFCLLYKEAKKCHEIENLNCYLCACPHFRFDDRGMPAQEGKKRYSFCAIDAKEGSAAIYGDAIHQDCSACLIPHHPSYIKKHFSLDWFEIMQQSDLTKMSKDA